MGTRGLTVVVLDGKHRVAQYGQWDHYPTGQGVKALTFCQENLRTEEGREKFKAAVAKTRFINEAEYKKLWKTLGVDLNKNDGMVPCDVSDKFSEKYPHLHRNCGAQILECVLNGAVDLQDEFEFGAGGEGGFFGCEGIYVVNLDKNTLEVYYGYDIPDRYQGTMHQLTGKDQAAVPFVAEFSLDNLPADADAREVMERLEKMMCDPEDREPEDAHLPTITGKSPREVAALAMDKGLSYKEKSVIRISQCAAFYDSPEETDTMVKDMLADLRHVCEANGLDFANLSRKSNRYYRDEVSHDSDGIS